MKRIITPALVILVIVGSIFIFVKGASQTQNGSNKSAVDRNNVTIEEGVQIVKVTAKGGYLPRRSLAKAGLPTILRFDTEGTFDCSSAVRIPSLDISRNLPISGLTDIELGSPEAGTLQGSCSMGMYPFEIVFQD